MARDGLSVATRNTLGAILTLFRLSDAARDELLRGAVPIGDPLPEPASTAQVDEGLESEDEARVASEGLDDVVERAGERIDDLIVRLDWEELQELAAGLLRAMGYRTQVAANWPVA